MSEEPELPVARSQRDVPFRIRVSLQRYFSDERARCYLMVSGGRSVCWLEERLRQLFLLPGSMRLVSGGHLLPRGESLALLHPDDLVDVIPILVIENAQKQPSVSTRAIADEALLLRRNLSVTDTDANVDVDIDAEGDGDGDGDHDDVQADALHQSKRRALELLDRLEVGDPRRRRRRRVHCRRRRVAPFDLIPAPAPAAVPAPATTPESAPVPASEPAPVVRGGATRSPRRVMPLL